MCSRNTPSSGSLSRKRERLESGSKRCFCRKEGARHRRARLYRLKPRPLSGRVRSGGHTSRQPDPGVWWKSLQYRAHKLTGKGELLGCPGRAFYEASRPESGLSVQSRRPDEPSRLHGRPLHGPRNQYQGAALHPGVVQEEQPGDKDRVCEHPADIRKAAVPSCRRGAPLAPGGCQRHQQDGGRVVSSGIQQRLRDPLDGPAAHEHLRAPDEDQGCQTDVSRHMDQKNHRGRSVSGIRRRPSEARFQLRG
ncbi:MAG: hypothetical protein BWZ01_03215 [Deltaproteobacteria bacterium ADurb.BinA179]|nr:MAG: hypothetical protein BWZ01_03215 [Deltaproteobacteria bacterium ADurb.BinA179]